MRPQTSTQEFRGYLSFSLFPGLFFARRGRARHGGGEIPDENLLMYLV